MVEYGQKTIKQALAEGGKTVVLHFDKHMRFRIEHEWHTTNHQGDYEFDLDSYFVTEVLGFNSEDVLVTEVYERARAYIQNDQEWVQHDHSVYGEDGTSGRPMGLTFIAIAWFIFGLINIFGALMTINTDLEVLPYLSGYGVHEWFAFAVPIELVLSIITLCVGLLQVVTIYGLLKGIKFAYKCGIYIPVAILVLNLLSLELYFSAPAEIGFGFNSVFWGALIGSGIGLVIYLQYFRKPHVKAFFGID